MVDTLGKVKIVDCTLGDVEIVVWIGENGAL
jgi:hypothetical protein